MQRPQPHTQFGRRLREELTRRDVSVRELARRMQPGNPEPMRRNVARWLSPLPDSAVSPSGASVVAVAEALGCPADELADDEEDLDVYAPLARAVQEAVRAEIARLVKA